MRQMRSGLRLAESRPFAAAVEKGSSDVCSVRVAILKSSSGVDPLFMRQMRRARQPLKNKWLLATADTPRVSRKLARCLFIQTMTRF